MAWGLVTFLLGIAYGYFASGRQDKSQLFKFGLIAGLVIAAAVAVAGFVGGAPALGFTGLLGILWTTLILTLLFIVGVWLGDMLEGKRKTRAKT